MGSSGTLGASVVSDLALSSGGSYGQCINALYFFTSASLTDFYCSVGFCLRGSNK